jgi:hypothetical protein
MFLHARNSTNQGKLQFNTDQIQCKVAWSFMLSNQGLRKICIVNLVNSVTEYGGFLSRLEQHPHFAEACFLKAELGGF